MEGFCPHPFSRAHLSVSGNVYICCAAWTGVSIGNIFQKPFDEIWNSAEAQKFRLSIIDKTFQYCRRKICPRIVSNIIRTQPVSKKYQDIITKKTTYMDEGPIHFSMNYDYSCNMFCTSCRNEKRVISKDRVKELIKFQDDLLKSDLFKNGKRLTITGAGEPFASSVFMDLLNKIDIYSNPDLKILLRTNGNLLNTKNWERIKNAHYAIDQISISIDAATEETYKKLRRGGDFNQLLKNLEFLKEINKEKDSKFKVRLSFVVQQDNFKEMPLFVKLAKDFECDKVAFTQLMDRGTYQDGQFSELTVHNSEHPEHNELLKILRDPLLKDPIISFNNISDLIYEE